VIDQCPEGTYCLENLCVEGESPFEETNPGMSMGGSDGGTAVTPIEQRNAPGSSCSSATQSRGIPLLLLALLALSLSTRRRARSL
jgi:hypothetical protein